MNLTWHIIKKDIRKQRWALLVWTGLLLAQIYLGEQLMSLESADNDHFDFYRGFQTVLGVITLVVGYLMRAAVVLDDPLTGPTAEWITRPISGGRLLGAKVLGLALMFFLWPLVLLLGWWAWSGLGWADVGTGIGQTAMVAWIPLLAALALGSLSKNSSEFSLGTLLLLLVLGGGSLLVNALKLTPPASPELAATRAVLAAGLMTITALLVVGLQYFTRQWRRSLIVATGGVLLGFVVGWTWPVDLTPYWKTRTEPDTPGTETIAVRWVRTKWGIGSQPILACGFVADGLTADKAVKTLGYTVTLRWADGSEWSGTNNRAAVSANPAVDGLFNVKKAGANESRTRTFLTWVSVPPEIRDKINREAPACTLALRLETGGPDLLWEMPLQAGATGKGRGVRVQLCALGADPGRLTPKAGSNDGVLVYSAPRSLRWLEFYAVDRPQGRVTSVARRINMIPKPDPTLSFINFSRLSLQWPEWLSIPEVPAATDTRTLAAVTYRPEATFSRTVTSERLVVEPTVSREGKRVSSVNNGQ